MRAEKQCANNIFFMSSIHILKVMKSTYVHDFCLGIYFMYVLICTLLFCRNFSLSRDEDRTKKSQIFSANCSLVLKKQKQIQSKILT